MNPRMPLIALATLGVAATACGSDDGGSSGLASGDDYTVKGALAELPADSAPDDSLLIQTGDLAAATELLGLERPDEPDVDAVIDWVWPLTGQVSRDSSDGDPEFAPVFVPLANMFNTDRLQEIADYDAALGWSLVDADAFVEQSTPPETFAVIAGDFDDDTLNSDLAEVRDGVVSYGDGDDLEHNIEEPTAVDPLGRPVRLAHDGDRIAASFSTPFAAEWVAGADETMADDESLGAIADALDDADVVSAVLTRVGSGFADVGGGRLSPEQMEALQEQIDSQLPEAPFDAVGFGWGVVDDEAAITVAYHFADEQAAQAAVEPLQNLYADGTSFQRNQPLSEILTVGEVTADGPVVSVALTLADEGRPQAIYDMLHARDLPFISR